MTQTATPVFKHGPLWLTGARNRCGQLSWTLQIFVFLLSQTASLPALSHRLPPAIQAETDPNAFVRNVLQNEIQAEQNDHSLWSYHERKMEHGREKLLSVCQTKKGNIEKLLAVNGQPLDANDDQAEDRRIESLITHPRQMAQEQKKENEDSEQAQDLLRMFPEAFRFEYQGTQGDVVKLKFTPNPKFHPSTRPELVFHHMEGTLLLDEHAQRLAAIDGILTSEVKFAGGWLGHLDKGGTFRVQQRDLGSGYWEITAMRVQMEGRVLFFKSISVQEDETYSDFKMVPENVSLQQAVELAKQGDIHHSLAMK